MNQQKISAQYEKTTYGFWLYLMSDMVLFAALFATFQVLRHNTAGGATGQELFDLPFVFVETVLLLVSSLTAGIGLVALKAKKVAIFRALLTITVVLGLAFLCMEISEFTHLVREGNSWAASGFLSAFFTLVGTHGFHILVGCLWAVALLVTSKSRAENDPHYLRKANMFTMFWHFLDFVWIFIFTVVYLMGVA